MIKEAMEHVQRLAAPNFKEWEGKLYSDKHLEEVKPEAGPLPKVLVINTLSGVADYIKNELDNESGYIVHVLDYNQVAIYGEYDPEFCRRKCYISAKSDLKRFEYGRFMHTESFIIGLMSFFQPTESLVNLLAYAGKMTDETTVNIDDDGITQTASVKTGVVAKADKPVPNPVELIPFETFPEIEGVPRKFIFRVTKSRGAVECALFESGDTKWELDYIQAIKRYFEEQLEGVERQISIIA